MRHLLSHLTFDTNKLLSPVMRYPSIKPNWCSGGSSKLIWRRKIVWIILFSRKSLHREKDERRTRYCSVLALVQPPSAWPWSRFQVSHFSQISNHFKRLYRRPPIWFREIEYEQNCILYICKISEKMEYFDKEIKFHIRKKNSINKYFSFIHTKKSWSL